jgi:hypothetical protein
MMNLLGTFEKEFNRSCSDDAGMLYEFDSIYKKGDSILCSSSCPCVAGNFI